MSEQNKQHTPGPWEVGRWFYKEGSQCGSVMISQAGEMYDHAEVYGRKGHPEGEANARLIASAPDLLQALRGMVSLHEQEWHEELPSSHIDDIIKNAHAAIAKAEGAKRD